jgi:hypothetical protein
MSKTDLTIQNMSNNSYSNSSGINLNEKKYILIKWIITLLESGITHNVYSCCGYPDLVHQDTNSEVTL